MWTSDFQSVYSSLTSYNWEASIIGLMTIFQGFSFFPLPRPSLTFFFDRFLSSDRLPLKKESYRHKMYTLISTGYSNIKLSDAAVFLGMDQSSAQQCLHQ